MGTKMYIMSRDARVTIKDKRVMIFRPKDNVERKTRLYYRDNKRVMFTCSVWKHGYKFLLF
jgi:hypothetical protein